MVKSEIISEMTANRLYWLGRYEERVYMTLHLLRKCYDKMIDGHPSDYFDFWKKLDTSDKYYTNEEFTSGMMYDENNPCSVITAQMRAMDNAMLLREHITSETLSYLEMSVSLMKKCKADMEMNITALQQVTDWSLAFWGSAEQRILNHKMLNIMHIGRNIENIDIQMRFDYPFRRVAIAYESLKKYFRDTDNLVDTNIEKRLDELITEEKFCNDIDYKSEVLKQINILVRV